MTDRTKAICKHCGLPITQFWGRLWHDQSPIFPQYCPTGDTKHEPVTDQLHEPEEPKDSHA